MRGWRGAVFLLRCCGTARRGLRHALQGGQRRRVVCSVGGAVSGRWSLFVETPLLGRAAVGRRCRLLRRRGAVHLDLVQARAAFFRRWLLHHVLVVVPFAAALCRHSAGRPVFSVTCSRISRSLSRIRSRRTRGDARRGVWVMLERSARVVTAWRWRSLANQGPNVRLLFRPTERRKGALAAHSIRRWGLA